MRARYEAYKSGSLCEKFSSSGPRLEHMSSETDSVGVQCAVEGVYAAAGEVTIVQRQWVRVGAAVVDEKRRVLAKSEMADVLRSMFASI